MRSTSRTSFRVVPVAVALVILLSGCGTQASTISSEPPRSSNRATPPAEPTPEATFSPDAPAEEALAFFDSVNAATLAADPAADGRAFVDNLAAAGFDKAAMELTADQTTIGNAADSVQFSVRWGDSCLIGQNGSAVDGYHSTVAPVLGTGKCLIGSTRPIDW